MDENGIAHDAPRLALKDFTVQREHGPVLSAVNLELARRSLVALVGSNGSGKTTLVQAVAGLLPASGTIALDGELLGVRDPRSTLNAGIALCPADRGLFPRLSVEENLITGGYTLEKREISARLELQLERFPALRQRLGIPAGQLSGGESQQLAVARCLMVAPRLLMLDEPSRGLSPQAADDLLNVLRDLACEGATILVVDQALDWLFERMDRLLVIAGGRITSDSETSNQSVAQLGRNYFDLE